MKTSSLLNTWDFVTQQLSGKHNKKPMTVQRHHGELIKLPIVLSSGKLLIMKEDLRAFRAEVDILTSLADVRQRVSVCLWITEERRKWRCAQMCSGPDMDFFLTSSEFSVCQMPACPHKHRQTYTSTQPVICCLTQKKHFTHVDLLKQSISKH